jgi:enamine deaminase RidA (YjgF/YER057c/UK114 family)
MDIEKRLQELGFTLPQPAIPVASYLPYRISGVHVYISGQLPMLDGQLLFSGKVGAEISIEQARRSAEICGLNILAQLKAACDGDWRRVTACIKLGGFVQCVPAFTDHPKVINGASDLMVAVLGDVGRHARFAVGVASLPLNACVEIDAIFEVRSTYSSLAID